MPYFLDLTLPVFIPNYAWWISRFILNSSSRFQPGFHSARDFIYFTFRQLNELVSKETVGLRWWARGALS